MRISDKLYGKTILLGIYSSVSFFFSSQISFPSISNELAFHSLHLLHHKPHAVALNRNVRVTGKKTVVVRYLKFIESIMVGIIDSSIRDSNEALHLMTIPVCSVTCK